MTCVYIVMPGSQQSIMQIEFRILPGACRLLSVKNLNSIHFISCKSVISYIKFFELKLKR